MKLEGVFTALITPFKENGSLDEEGLKVLIERQLKAKVHGIVVLGTTGEAPALTSQEQESIIKISRKLIPKSTLFMVGTGAYATQATINHTKKAQDLGADACLIVTPYYNRPTQEGLYLHFEAISKAVTIPYMVYNVPSRTGQNLSTPTLKKIAALPHVFGVKEASGSLSQMMEIIEMISSERTDFKIFSGDDNLFFPLMTLGGHGVISVLSNLIPELMVELFHLSIAEKYTLARHLHFALLPLMRALFIETNPIPIKSLMRYENHPAGHCRLPLCDLTSDNEKKLLHILETLKLPLLHA